MASSRASVVAHHLARTTASCFFIHVRPGASSIVRRTCGRMLRACVGVNRDRGAGETAGASPLDFALHDKEPGTVDADSANQKCAYVSALRAFEPFMKCLSPLSVRIYVRVRMLHQEEQEGRIEAGRKGMRTWRVIMLYTWPTHVCGLAAAGVSQTKVLDATVTPACQVLPGLRANLQVAGSALADGDRDGKGAKKGRERIEGAALVMFASPSTKQMASRMLLSQTR
jgi:hypothetical protein